MNGAVLRQECSTPRRPAGREILDRGNGAIGRIPTAPAAPPKPLEQRPSRSARLPRRRPARRIRARNRPSRGGFGRATVADANISQEDLQSLNEAKSSATPSTRWATPVTPETFVPFSVIRRTPASQWWTTAASRRAIVQILLESARAPQLLCSGTTVSQKGHRADRRALPSTAANSGPTRTPRHSGRNLGAAPFRTLPWTRSIRAQPAGPGR